MTGGWGESELGDTWRTTRDDRFARGKSAPRRHAPRMMLEKRAHIVQARICSLRIGAWSYLEACGFKLSLAAELRHRTSFGNNAPAPFHSSLSLQLSAKHCLEM